LASLALLRFKSLAVEEEGYLAHLQRGSPDVHIRTVATAIRRLHQQLAEVARDVKTDDRAKTLTDELDSKELELGQIMQGRTPYLQVKNVSLSEVRAALAPNSALLELRAYRATDFKAGELRDWRWAGVLIPAEGDIEMRDLGAATETAAQVQAILANGASAKAANEALSTQLLLPFAASTAKLRRLYIAPDAVLSLLPFGLLQDTAGGRLMESVDVRTLQTGRDLLRLSDEHPAKGMIAVGGIDFDTIEAEPKSSKVGAPVSETHLADAINSDTVATTYAWPLTQTRLRTADTFRNGFAALASSKLEVEAIGSQYRIWRRDETVLIAEGTKPTKDWLLARSPPRVLHLATHGFYREQRESADQPLLLAGLALAGANQGLKRQDGSGILYALEAQDLNLEGTELVVLSACDTALGQIDYGEGVSGLVRALRTAGARNVLVTLRAVGDESATLFMERFYYYWFKQNGSDPAAALRDAQLAATGNDSTWTSFVMIGG
jgi:CHAT domain-containing protein